jgi:DNA polymerase-3 subunit delta
MMKYEQILKDLENKIYYPVYLLFGDEPYYIDEIATTIEENVLSETEKEFNLSVLYGRDADALKVLEYAKRYPMMASYQVVIIREAQDMDNLEDLQSYVENPLDTTILVLAHKYKRVDKRKAFIKAVDKKGVLFESRKLYDYKIPDWITEQLISMGYGISIKACMMLTENLGNDLGKIRNEIEKLVINLEKGTQINEEIIERNIGISKDFNVFELTNALGEKDSFKAFRIAKYFAANPKIHPMVVTLTMLYNYFVKLLMYHQIKDKSKNNVASILGINPYFVKDYANAAKKYPGRKLIGIIRKIHQYDLKVKGVNNTTTNEGELLRELIYGILN